MKYLIVKFTPSEYKRIFEKIKVNKKTSCWNWIGGKDQQGYGQGYYNHKRERVHRLIYAYFKGPIPRGKKIQLDHLCRNTSCCNPEHLELVPQKINIIRGNGITAINSRKKYCKYGHELPPYDINKSRKYCKICDSIRHKKRIEGPNRKYWLNKANEATKRYYQKHK